MNKKGSVAKLLRSFFVFTLWIVIIAFKSNAEDRNNLGNGLGIWVEVEGKVRTLDSREDVDRLINFLSKHNFNEIYLQVYRGGKSWFPSSHADPSPYLSAMNKGVDPIREVLNFCLSKNIKVHGWLNILRVENRSSLLIQELGEDVVLHDKPDRNLLVYNDGRSPEGRILDTPGFWLDPSNSKLRERVNLVIQDLLSAYPELEGIHLDIIRNPFFYGYYRNRKGKIKLGGDQLELLTSKNNLMEFFKSNSLEEHIKLTADVVDWNNWRRSQVSGVVEEISSLIKSQYPDKKLSAAVIADYFTAKDYAFQEWGKWMLEGRLDYVVLMNYTTSDTRLVNNLANAKLFSAKSKALVKNGIGAWLFKSKRPEDLIDQINRSYDNVEDGVVLFSYANLVDTKLSEKFRRSELKQD